MILFLRNQTTADHLTINSTCFSHCCPEGLPSHWLCGPSAFILSYKWYRIVSDFHTQFFPPQARCVTLLKIQTKTNETLSGGWPTAMPARSGAARRTDGPLSATSSSSSSSTRLEERGERRVPSQHHRPPLRLQIKKSHQSKDKNHINKAVWAHLVVPLVFRGPLYPSPVAAAAAYFGHLTVSVACLPAVWPWACVGFFPSLSLCVHSFAWM